MLLCPELERVMAACLVLTNWATWRKDQAFVYLLGEPRDLHQTTPVSSTLCSRCLFPSYILRSSLFSWLCAFTLWFSYNCASLTHFLPSKISIRFSVDISALTQPIQEPAFRSHWLWITSEFTFISKKWALSFEVCREKEERASCSTQPRHGQGDTSLQMLVSGTGSGSGGMRLLCGLGLGSADVRAFTLCGRVFLYLGLTALLDYKTL